MDSKYIIDQRWKPLTSAPSKGLRSLNLDTQVKKDHREATSLNLESEQYDTFVNVEVAEFKKENRRMISDSQNEAEKLASLMVSHADALQKQAIDILNQAAILRSQAMHVLQSDLGKEDCIEASAEEFHGDNIQKRETARTDDFGSFDDEIPF